MGHSTGLIQVVIFEAADRDNIGGSAYGGQRSICCTPDLAKLEGCKQGEVIRIPSATDINWPIVLNVQFSGKSLSTSMANSEVPITKTGMYNLFFISCDPKLKGLVMNGKTLWKNPDGYLPGRMAPLMKFYVYMSLAYVLLCVTWFFQYMRFWKDILQLQHCITVVISLGLFEMILWYFEFENFNRTGTRPVGITTWVVTVGAVRRTVSRLLILSVSMGYGVVRPTLGVLPQRARLFLVLPDAFLDAFLILWIFTSLSKTLEQLQAKRSSVKLDTYRKFSNSLAVAVIASVVWIGYELIPDRTWGFMLGSIGLYWFASVLRSFGCPGPAFVFLASELSEEMLEKELFLLVGWSVGSESNNVVYFKATDPFNERWQSAWIITAFWDILAFGLLCVICYLWAPSQSSQRYAYSDEKGEEFDDEETQSLTRGKPEGDISLAKQDNLEDEEEEDKRE
ncbi:Transmembrane protein 87B [Vitis vinifera]|uniref:Transmembrane protein 87B n=1 Tax=Vitis vinifera TaxID=29760 RepID=A0A438D512_VITVI|nr:Transmembrane protein 87B [Vitis vinifera]